MEPDITILPAGDLIPPEQLEQWKEHNRAEAELFDRLLVPQYERLLRHRDSVPQMEEFEQELEAFFEGVSPEAYWKDQLIWAIRDWIDNTRPCEFAEPLFLSLEKFITERLTRPLERVDESGPEHRIHSASQ